MVSLSRMHVVIASRSCAVAAILATVVGLAPLSRLDAQAAPPPRTLTLGAPVLTTGYDFTYLTAAVRLANGNILVADPGEVALTLVDGRTGAARIIGRQGAGPGEYQEPRRLLALDDGRVLMFDDGLRRVSRISSSGTVESSTPAPSRGAGMSNARSVDRAGRVYYTEPVFDEKTRATAPNSNVVRWSWGELTAATVMPIAAVRTLNSVQKMPDGNSVFVARFVPHSHVDAFVVLRDGTRVVARATSRIIEWRDSTDRVLETQPFPGVLTVIPDSALNRIKPDELRAAVGKWYPPFNYESIVRSNDDRVWLRAVLSQGDSATWYGFRRGERAPLAVNLGRRAEILSVSEPWVLVSRRNADDLSRLEVYQVTNARRR